MVQGSSEGCDVAQSGWDVAQMVVRQAGQSSIFGLALQGGFSHWADEMERNLGEWRRMNVLLLLYDVDVME